MQLVIVESPTKARTLSGFLGREYRVLSSFGHVRDLPESELGVDIQNDFSPQYVIPQKAKKVIAQLKKEVKRADSTILATDEDREGEAIAWHLSQVLGLKNPKRIVFHEITKEAIEEALRDPKTINLNLVDAQQARRILDRLVGYKLSPFLWKKVARRLSAGRVQSVAVRFIAEREREIQNFIPQEYWTIEASFEKSKKKFTAILIKKDGRLIGRLGIKTKKEAEEIISDLKGAEYKIEKIGKKELKRNPLPPFTTSTLQQVAWQRLRFPAKLTMSVAQQLYEMGYITYHRTDSLNLSQFSLDNAKKFIEENYGRDYWPGFQRKFKTKSKLAQEAHEAIRPTYLKNIPKFLKNKLDANPFKLYELIWRRFLACQMSPALFDSTYVEISAKNYTFKTVGQILKFDGFLRVYPIEFKETELPSLEKSEILNLKSLNPYHHFTEPPPRYTEATLVKTLEKYGIGRPSTYAPIISTIQERGYVEKDEQKRFRPTDLGIAVNNLLSAHFPEIVDIKFTAEMEKKLDEIAQGKNKWVPMIRKFYEPFEETLQKKYKEVSKKDIAQEATEKICPRCNAPILIRLGRFGKFYACSKFPKCRYTEVLEQKENRLGIVCPKCNEGEIVTKRTKKAKTFYGCSKYPKCDFALWYRPTGEKCKVCGSLLVKKANQVRCSNPSCESREI